MALKPTGNFALLLVLAGALLFAGFAGEDPTVETDAAAGSAVAAPSTGDGDAAPSKDDAADAGIKAPSAEEKVASVDENASSSEENAVSGDEPPAPEKAASGDDGAPPPQENTAAADGADVDPAPSPAEEAVAETPAPAPVSAAEEEIVAAPLPPPVAPVREERQPRVIIVPSSEARNINAAMVKARPGDTVRVKNGTYRETILVTPGVALVAENMFRAVLDGRGRNTIVTMSNNSTIDGFEIRRGTIGIFSTSSHVTIRRNRIAHNIQSGVMCVGTLPKMEDNFIVFNRGSGIQGWDVRTTSGSINHNTIAFNTNHGIALGGTTSITVENNIIAFNDQFGVKPGEETVRVELINNNFYRNARISSSLPSDNISADPMFTDAKRFNFNLANGSTSIGMGTDNQNLGARILH